MPKVLQVGKYRFFFFSREGKEPVHIHVESGGDYAKYWLEPVSLATSVGYSAKELNEIKKLVLENIKFLKDKWHEHFN
ncbi:MAG: DUF4160 domain-containing protein [bacterium]